METAVEEAVYLGGKVCVLGETFNSIYTKPYLIQNAEHFDSLISNLFKAKAGITLTLVQKLAVKH